MKSQSLIEKFSFFMMKIARFFIKFGIYVVIVYFVGMFLFNFGKRLFVEKAVNPTSKESIVVTIDSNDSIKDVAEKLYDLNLIDDKIAFMFRSKIYKIKFNPNKYVFNKSMTIKNMLDAINDENMQYIVKEDQNDIYQLSPEN